MNRCIKATFEFTRSPSRTLVGINATKLYSWMRENYPDDPSIELGEDEEEREVLEFLGKYKRSGAYK